MNDTCSDNDPHSSTDATTLAPGRYRHFKGGEYEVHGIARHSETEEQLVVYTPLYGAGGLWVRPLDMFTETVERDGQKIPRFARITDNG